MFRRKKQTTKPSVNTDEYYQLSEENARRGHEYAYNGKIANALFKGYQAIDLLQKINIKETSEDKYYYILACRYYDTASYHLLSNEGARPEMALQYANKAKESLSRVQRKTDTSMEVMQKILNIIDQAQDKIQAKNLNSASPITSNKPSSLASKRKQPPSTNKKMTQRAVTHKRPKTDPVGDTKSADKLRLFSNSVTIKQEKCHININEIAEQISSIIKIKRQGSNASKNCGYIAKYTILALRSLIYGESLPDEKININNDDNAECELTYQFVPIKNEKGAIIKKESRTTQAEFLVGDKGLSSILPAKYYNRIVLTDEINKEVTEIDLEAKLIPTIRVKYQNINEELQNTARNSGRILIGHILLEPKRRNGLEHIVVFIADASKVFYIDGQLYNGRKKTGEPVFTDLMSHYTFAPQQIGSQGYYIDDVFYLIHEEIPQYQDEYILTIPRQLGR